MDADLEEMEKKAEDKIRIIRKEAGKRNQRRKYEDESSAPKRSRTNEGYKSSRRATGDDPGPPKEKRKEYEETTRKDEKSEAMPEKIKGKTRLLLTVI